MPNICVADIKVKGYKDNVDEFVRILNADYNYNKMEFSHKPHFFRVFSAVVYDEYIEGLIKVLTICIECAWSVAVCMQDGKWSYYESVKNEFNEFYGTHLTEISKKLNISIEIISHEEGMGFEEHYRYNSQGTLLEDECSNIEYYDPAEYDNVEDFNKECGTEIDELEFNMYKEEELEVPRFKYYYQDYKVDDRINIANRIMVEKIDREE